jgi:glycosyltransferase involved in cell wall biosynthesis
VSSAEGDVPPGARWQDYAQWEQCFPSDERPLLTIITICFRDEAGLRRTLASVAAQTDADLEHIVIDGGSGPAVCDLLEQWQNTDHPGRRFWISRPDNGISDAFNRGVVSAHGRWLCFLNAGDVLHQSTTLAGIQEHLPPEGVLASRAAFGRITIPTRDIDQRTTLRWRAMISHQASVVERELFRRHGLYDPSFKVRMDFEWWLRVLPHTTLCFLDRITVDYDVGGVSGARRLLFLREELRAIRRNVSFWPYWVLESLARFAVRECLYRIRGHPAG